MSSCLPLLVELEQIESSLQDPNVVIVDLSRLPSYVTHHIPGAVHLEYAALVRSAPPVMGLLPDLHQLQSTLQALGIYPDSHVVAYDDEGGGKASRLLWTLDCIGHQSTSLVNGGIQAWIQGGYDTETNRVSVTKSDYQISQYLPEAIADKNYILQHIEDENVIFLDTRTAGEFTGRDVRAARGGHIPGARHLEWIANIDIDNAVRLKPADLIESQLQALNITRDKTIVTYCQTHHRSSHTYMTLKILGFEQIKGYPGAWSEWGNDPDTPIELDPSLNLSR